MSVNESLDIFVPHGRAINPRSAKQVKQNKKDKGTSYSDAYFTMLNDLKLTVEHRLREII